MMTLNTTRITPAARRWLRQTAAARVYQLFARTCTLINQHDELLSLVSAPEQMGPFALAVAGLGKPFTALLTPQTAVRVRESTFSLGALQITTQGAEIWSPRVNWARLAEAPYLAVLAAQAAIWQKTSGLTTHAVWPIAGPLLAQLGAGLREGNPSLCIEATAGLAGLGPGLTPAGDDFLMGVLYALAVRPGRGPAAGLIKAIVQTAVPRTTRLSANWLRAAARGEAAAPWHAWAAAIRAGEPSAVRQAERQILDTGHTSGADALTGFFVALNC